MRVIAKLLSDGRLNLTILIVKIWTFWHCENFEKRCADVQTVVSWPSRELPALPRLSSKLIGLSAILGMKLALKCITFLIYYHLSSDKLTIETPCKYHKMQKRKTWNSKWWAKLPFSLCISEQFCQDIDISVWDTAGTVGAVTRITITYRGKRLPGIIMSCWIKSLVDHGLSSQSCWLWSSSWTVR